MKSPNVAFLRAEKHCLIDGVLCGTGGFPLVLNALSAHFERLVILVPVVKEGLEFDGTSSGTRDKRLGFVPRENDVIIPLPNLTGYRRAFFAAPKLAFALFKARKLSNRLVLRTPEHISFISIPLARFLWRKPTYWYVAERIRSSGRTWRDRLKAPFERILGWIETRGMAEAQVIANGSHLAGLVEGATGNDRVTCVVSTTLPRDLTAPLRSARDMHLVRSSCGERFEMLFVGRIVPSKGLEVIFHAMQMARTKTSRRLDLRIVGWGAPAYVASLQKLAARLDLTETIVFAGPVAFGSSLFDAYAKAHLFVLPSIHSEGTPRVLSEAIALGLPVLASNQSGAIDVLGPLLFDMLQDPGDAAALCDTIVRLAEDQDAYVDLITRTAARGRELDVEALADKMAAVLRKNG